jgi:hypothetical protein
VSYFVQTDDFFSSLPLYTYETLFPTLTFTEDSRVRVCLETPNPVFTAAVLCMIAAVASIVSCLAQCFSMALLVWATYVESNLA